MNSDHPTDMLPAFALGSLDEQEREVVSRHLGNCDDCRRELAVYQELAEHLALGAPAEYPPESLKRRLMARIAFRSRTPGRFETIMATRPRLVFAAVVTGLFLVAALGVSNVMLWHQIGRDRTNAIGSARVVWLVPTAEAPGATGSLVVGPDESRALLLVDALLPLAPDAQYQLWLIKDGRRTSGAVFSVAADGKAAVTVVATRPLVDFDAFGITIEPFGGSPGPTGKKVLGGRMKL